MSVNLGRAMDSAPKDGTLLRLLVVFTDNNIDDTGDEATWTIGNNNADNTGVDEWEFVGWCWAHDHFTNGEGTPVSWLPLIPDEEGGTK
jgi:hypothetical protein